MAKRRLRARERACGVQAARFRWPVRIDDPVELSRTGDVKSEAELSGRASPLALRAADASSPKAVRRLTRSGLLPVARGRCQDSCLRRLGGTRG